MYNDKNIKDRQNMQQWKQINATPMLLHLFMQNEQCLIVEPVFIPF